MPTPRKCETGAKACAATAKGFLMCGRHDCARGSTAQRLYPRINSLRRLVEISKQRRTEPAFHIEVRATIPITAVLISTHPVEPVLVTGEGRGGESA